jgi:dTMP kinase
MLISLEGLDGSGKSTVMNAITDKYPNAVTTREPSELTYGQLVRERLSDESSNELIDFYLFMCDRVHHIEERVKPGVEEGRLVISDRYADSTRAYQPVALTRENSLFDSEWEAKYFIEQSMRPWSYEPDLTLYIDISVDTALKRTKGDEKYEKRDFLRKVRQNYEALCDSNQRIVRIDGEQSEDEVATSALGKVDVASPDRL